MVTVKEIRNLIDGMKDDDEIIFFHNDGNYSHLLDSIKDYRRKDGELRIIIESYLDAYMRDIDGNQN